MEHDPRRARVVGLVVAPGDRRVDFHELEDLVRVLRHRLTFGRGVEEEAYRDLSRLRTRVAERGNTLAWQRVGRPSVHPLERELARVEEARKLRAAALDLEKRFFAGHQKTPGWCRRPRRSSSAMTRSSIASMMRSISSLSAGLLEFESWSALCPSDPVELVSRVSPEPPGCCRCRCSWRRSCCSAWRRPWVHGVRHRTPPATEDRRRRRGRCCRRTGWRQAAA